MQRKDLVVLSSGIALRSVVSWMLEENGAVEDGREIGCTLATSAGEQ